MRVSALYSCFIFISRWGGRNIHERSGGLNSVFFSWPGVSLQRLILITICICLYLSIINRLFSFLCSNVSSSFDEFDYLSPNSMAVTLYKDISVFPILQSSYMIFFLLALFFL